MKTGLGWLLLAFSSLAYSVNRMIDDGDFPSGGSGSTALGIGMIHALPMLGVAAWTRSKVLTVLTGIGMVGVALAIGGARYAVFDLFFVALGTWGGFRLCVPKGLSAEQRRVIGNVLDGPQAEHHAMTPEKTTKANPTKRLSEFARAKLAADAASLTDAPKRIEIAKSILADVEEMNDVEMRGYFRRMSFRKCGSLIHSFTIPGWLAPDSVVVKTHAKGMAWWDSVGYPSRREAAWAILTMIKHATGHAHPNMSERELLHFFGGFILEWRQQDCERDALLQILNA